MQHPHQATTLPVPDTPSSIYEERLASCGVDQFSVRKRAERERRGVVGIGRVTERLPSAIPLKGRQQKRMALPDKSDDRPPERYGLLVLLVRFRSQDGQQSHLLLVGGQLFGYVLRITLSETFLGRRGEVIEGM
jgi:hypothetical protein